MSVLEATELYVRLILGKMVNFMLCVFYGNDKRKKTRDGREENREMEETQPRESTQAWSRVLAGYLSPSSQGCVPPRTVRLSPLVGPSQGLASTPREPQVRTSLQVLG